MQVNTKSTQSKLRSLKHIHYKERLNIRENIQIRKLDEHQQNNYKEEGIKTHKTEINKNKIAIYSTTIWFFEKTTQ